MKKLILKKGNIIYVTKNAKGIYCDFCGVLDSPLFESEWVHPSDGSKSDMQICVDCVKQLYKLI